MGIYYKMVNTQQCQPKPKGHRLFIKNNKVYKRILFIFRKKVGYQKGNKIVLDDDYCMRRDDFLKIKYTVSIPVIDN